MAEFFDYYVYLWRNKLDGKCYVGKGRGKRAYSHLRVDGSSRAFHRALRAYGADNFELSFLATNMREKLAFQVEIQVIAALNSIAPNGYNLTPGGDGVGITDAIRKQISSTVTAQWNDPEQRSRRLAIMRTPEYRAKISASSRNPSPETRRKLSETAHSRKPDELKTRVLELMRTGLSTRQVAEKLGCVHHSSIGTWLKNAGWTKIGTTRPVWVPPEAAKSEES